MNTKTLVKLLEIEKIPSRWYSINDETTIAGDTSVIKNVDNKYCEYFFFNDRGGKDDYVKFDGENNTDNESRACKFLLKDMLNTKECYIKVGLPLNGVFNSCTNNNHADFYVGPSGNVYEYNVFPEKSGAEGSWSSTKLQPGTIIDRYGESTGKYLYPVNTPLEQRLLSPWTDFNEYHQYEVIKEYEFKSSIIAPYFDQPGGGIQYKSKVEINELLKDGILKEVVGY